MRIAIFWTSIVTGLAASSAFAVDIHVDNVNGSDGNDGLAAEIVTSFTGPVRTIRRGTELLRRGDALVIRNTGRPYFESLYLSGGRHSGYEEIPFIIHGNGAMLCGLRQLPSDGWRPVDEGLWRLTLTRKGYYRFFREGKAWPEFIPTATPFNFDELPEGHWASWQGAVYFRVPDRQPPADAQWTYAAGEQGISLVDVRNVLILDLQVAGFRVDGINADNTCRNIVVERVTTEHNGRAGLAVGGSARVVLRNSRVNANGRHSVLVTESAGVEVVESDLGGVEPTLVRSSPAASGVSVSAAASTSAKVRPVVLK
jgi:hypothetical protein